MLSNLLLLCLIGHVIGAYYLPLGLDDDKYKRFGKLLLHIGIYCIPFIFLFLMFGRSNRLFIAFLLLFATHFIIEFLGFFFLKSRLYQRLRKKYKSMEFSSYVIHRSLHILSIVLIGIYFSNTAIRIQLDAWIHIFLKTVNLDLTRALRWILLVLCIYKPVNTAFAVVFSHYKPELKGESASVKKAGAVIGFLERFLIIIFINIQQYSAIGLILTAKSIARYDSISKSQDFAEYYLIGTLSSLLSAILLYIIIFRHL